MNGMAVRINEPGKSDLPCNSMRSALAGTDLATFAAWKCSHFPCSSRFFPLEEFPLRGWGFRSESQPRVALE